MDGALCRSLFECFTYNYIMPGISTHFKILELSIAKLKASGSSSLQEKGTIMEDNPEYAYLGAIGPILADFIPSDPPPDPDFPIGYSNEYAALWKNALIFAGDNPVSGAKGMITILEEFDTFLNTIQPIADNEDLNALKEMRDNGEIDAIIDTAASLSTLVNDLTSPDGFVFQIAGAIGSGNKPTVNVGAGNPIPETILWTIREQMFWQKTGDFVKALVTEAEDSGDDRFKAYAYGYVTCYAGLVAGSPFINTIIGGTFRTDWWRQRWINVFVDAWTYGYYESGATMAGDIPTPDYENWPGICDAKLYEHIAIGGITIESIFEVLHKNEAFPKFLPEAFVQYWRKAYESAYGPIGTFSRFKENSLNSAYAMTWAMLWFQSSGKVVGCNIPPPMSPPSNCDDEPSWADPTVPGDSGGGSIPPEPTVESDPDVGKIITGAILALLGLAGFAAGGLVSGGVAIGVGVDLIIDGATDINWNKLRCDLYWYRMYLYRGLSALHEVMVLGGLQHPYPAELKDDETVMNFLGFEFRFDSGKKNAKSRNLDVFPPKPWSGSISITGLWIDRPSRPQEQVYSTPYLSADKYPVFFIDDDANNPLSKGKIRNKAPNFIHGDGALVGKDATATGHNRPVEFGNAVANAIDLLEHNEFPNWNLDADRGLAYLSWAFGDEGDPSPMYTDPVKVHPLD